VFLESSECHLTDMPFIFVCQVEGKPAYSLFFFLGTGKMRGAGAGKVAVGKMRGKDLG
jgi:hypothetical protein